MLFYLNMIDLPEDRDKFEALYRKYRQLMQYAANEILQDNYLAEDAVHAAFLKIIPRIGRIGEVDCHKTKAFVIIVAENEAKRIYAARRRQNTIAFEEVQEDPVDHDGGVEQLLAELTVEEIAAGIEDLSKLDSDILTLRYIHGLTDKEIARLLNIHEAAVRKRIERARRRLAVQLRRVGERHAETVGCR